MAQTMGPTSSSRGNGYFWPFLVAVVVVGSVVAWLGAQPASSLVDEQPSFLQVSFDQEMEWQELEDYCMNEMKGVQQLLESAPTLGGSALLWSTNQIALRLQNAGSFASLLREVHPNKDVREAASRCVSAVSSNSSAVDLSRPLYDALSKLKNTQRRRQLTTSLPPNDVRASASAIVASHDSVRFVTKMLEDYERRGVGIVPEQDEEAFFRNLQAIQAKMTDLTQRYDEVLSTDRRGIWVAVTQAPAGEVMQQQQQQQQRQASAQVAAHDAGGSAAEATEAEPERMNEQVGAGRRAQSDNPSGFPEHSGETHGAGAMNRSTNAEILAGVEPVGKVTLAPASALPLSEAVSLAELPLDFLSQRLRTVTPQQWAEAVAARKQETLLAKEHGGEAFQWPAPLPAGSPAPLTVVEISTDYPDSGPAVRYALDRRLRASVSLQSSRRGYPANLQTLAALLKARSEYASAIAEAKAAASGRRKPLSPADCSYANISLAPTMAKSPAAVRELLQRVQGIAQGPGEKERAALLRILQEELEKQPEMAQGSLPPTLLPSDVPRLVDAVRAKAFNVSSDKVRQYFTYAHARRGVLTTAAKLFHLRFAVVAAPSLKEGGLGAKAKDRQIDICLQPHFAQALPVCEHSVVTPLDESAVAAEASSVPEAHRWHPSVEVLDVYESSDTDDDEEDASASPSSITSGWTTAFTPTGRGDYIGRLYIDAHPRENKYKHMAMFPVKAGVIRWREPSEADSEEDGSSQAAVAAEKASRQLRSRVREFGDGTEPVTAQRPEAALVCNFEPHGPMEHGDVVTLFHEFGHAMHHLLGGRSQRYAAFSGTATETDFVEVPSQLNEAFAWDERVLASFAGRIRSDEEMQNLPPGSPQVDVIPSELVRRMRAADATGRALSAWRQQFLSQLSLRLHSGEFTFDPSLEPRATGARKTVSPVDGAEQGALEPGGDSAATDKQQRARGPKCPSGRQAVPVSEATRTIEKATSPFPHTPGAHLPANFGHLTGYAAQYYAYSWSDVIVKDMLGPFYDAKNATGQAANAEMEAAKLEAKATGESSESSERDPTQEGSDDDPDAGSLLAAKSPARRYRRDVLEMGGRMDGGDIVHSFLGRPFGYDAFQKWLEEGASAAWVSQ